MRAARRAAWWLDASIPIPGTEWRIGLDPILGLVPGLGDAVGAVASLFVLAVAARLGAPPSLLARIVGNVALDAIVGAVPLVGDLADAAFRANTRNVELLERWLAEPRAARRASRAVVAGWMLALVLVIAALGWAAFSLVAWAVRTVRGG